MNGYKFDPVYPLGSTVYLITDDEQFQYVVISHTYTADGGFHYTVRSIKDDEMRQLYEAELSDVKIIV